MPEPIGEYVTEFSEPGGVALPWSDIERVLRESEMFWLSTVRRDGRPHVAPLPAMWLDGMLHFCTGAHEQKARNIESNPWCVLTTGSSDYREGLDVIVEGTVAQVADEARLTRLARMWLEKLDWPFEVVDGQFSDPGIEGHLAPVFAVAPTKVLAFRKAPYSQSRYVFPRSGAAGGAIRLTTPRTSPLASSMDVEQATVVLGALDDLFSFGGRHLTDDPPGGSDDE